jgi:hypothetical protein
MKKLTILALFILAFFGCDEPQQPVVNNPCTSVDTVHIYVHDTIKVKKLVRIIKHDTIQSNVLNVIPVYDTITTLNVVTIYDTISCQKDTIKVEVEKIVYKRRHKK